MALQEANMQKSGVTVKMVPQHSLGSMRIRRIRQQKII